MLSQPAAIRPADGRPCAYQRAAQTGRHIFVSQLTGFPFLQGAAKVHNLDTAGNLSVHAEGFSCLTDMHFDPADGNLCVMQFGVFGDVGGTLNFMLGSAAVIKLMPDGSRDTIAQGIGGWRPVLLSTATAICMLWTWCLARY